MIDELYVCQQLRERFFTLERKIRARVWEEALDEIARARVVLDHIEIEVRRWIREYDG